MIATAARVPDIIRHNFKQNVSKYGTIDYKTTISDSVEYIEETHSMGWMGKDYNHGVSIQGTMKGFIAAALMDLDDVNYGATLKAALDVEPVIDIKHENLVDYASKAHEYSLFCSPIVEPTDIMVDPGIGSISRYMSIRATPPPVEITPKYEKSDYYKQSLLPYLQSYKIPFSPHQYSDERRYYLGFRGHKCGRYADAYGLEFNPYCPANYERIITAHRTPHGIGLCWERHRTYFKAMFYDSPDYYRYSQEFMVQFLKIYDRQRESHDASYLLVSTNYRHVPMTKALKFMKSAPLVVAKVPLYDQSDGKYRYYNGRVVDVDLPLTPSSRKLYIEREGIRVFGGPTAFSSLVSHKVYPGHKPSGYVQVSPAQKIEYFLDQDRVSRVEKSNNIRIDDNLTIGYRTPVQTNIVARHWTYEGKYGKKVYWECDRKAPGAIPYASHIVDHVVPHLPSSSDIYEEYEDSTYATLNGPSPAVADIRNHVVSKSLGLRIHHIKSIYSVGPYLLHPCLKYHSNYISALGREKFPLLFAPAPEQERLDIEEEDFIIDYFDELY